MHYVFTLIAITIAFLAHAQVPGVGINSNGASPDPSSILDVSSTTQGVLFPRMTATQMGQISSPATGLLVFQTGSTGRVPLLWMEVTGPNPEVRERHRHFHLYQGLHFH